MDSNSSSGVFLEGGKHNPEPLADGGVVWKGTIRERQILRERM